MSQTRMHKEDRKRTVSSKNSNTAVQVNTAKVIDDFRIENERGNQVIKRSRSKNKLPKSVRLDLENALVGLCDVWFEEIKPHLVRNNIKLHVPVARAGCGDYEQQLPRTAAKCTHLDPGAVRDLPQHMVASYAGCSFTPAVALKVPCPKLPKLYRQQRQSPQQPRLFRRHYAENPLLSHKGIKQQKPALKKRHSSQTQTSSNWRVPQLCHTYSRIPSFSKQSVKSSPFNDAYVRDLFKSIFNKGN